MLHSWQSSSKVFEEELHVDMHHVCDFVKDVRWHTPPAGLVFFHDFRGDAQVGSSLVPIDALLLASDHNFSPDMPIRLTA